MRSVLCVGGSETAGVRTTRGWPEHLSSALDADGCGALVYNRGRAGARLLDVLRQLPDDLQVCPRPDVLVVAIPRHDARAGGTPPSELRALLETVLRWAPAGRVVLCTPLPVGAAPLGPVRGFARPARRWVEKGSRVLRDVAIDHDAQVVTWDTMPTELLADVAHPGPNGYRWLAEQVRPAVRRVLSA